MATTDAMLLLRDHMTGKRRATPSADGESLVFTPGSEENTHTPPESAPDAVVIPLDTATRYVQPNTTAPLSLRAIWFYLPWVDEPYGKYVVASTKVGIARVSLAVAKDLLNWLRGVSATSDNLVPLSSGEVPKRPLDETERGGDRPPKRQKTGDDDGAAAAATAEVEMTEAEIDDAGLDFDAMTSVQVRNFIVGRERTLLDRNSVMRAPDKDFRSIVQIARTAEAKRKSKERQEQLVKVQHEKNKQRSKYNRYEVEETAFWRETAGLDTADFGIDTGASMETMFGAAAAAGGGGGGGGSAAAAVAQAVAAAAAGGGGSSGGAPPRSGERSSRTRSKVPPRSSRSSSKKKRKSKLKSSVPIIIVPSGRTKSLVTLYNVEDFLINSIYISTEEKKRDGGKRSKKVVIHRPKGPGTTVPYHVVDNPKSLDMDDWKRVVAVFTVGTKWEWREFPFKSAMDTLRHVAGYHIKFDDQPTPPTIGDLNVVVYSLNRNPQRRNGDAVVALEFWNSLDKWIARHKPDLKY